MITKPLLSACFSVLSFSIAFAQSSEIKLNQLGFYPGSPKIAVITSPAGSKFFIVSAKDKKTVFKGELGKEMLSGNSSLKTRIANFSTLKKPGSYFISVPGIGVSYRFKIAKQVNAPIAVSSLKGFYYQRVSMPLEQKYAGKWHRPAGHPDTAVLIHSSASDGMRSEGAFIKSPGGWYDAGDYNKYIVNSGITMGTIFSAYEDFPSYFDTLKTNIPESGNKVPDVLDEALYNLRWMLTMQDPNDGGVYHKCTNAAFDGMVMPGVTKLPRYAVQKGTAATLDFAAVAAQAARIFRGFDKQLPGLADSCIKASKYAWSWALKNPALAYNQNQMNQKYTPKITSGDYGDGNFKDEWQWAAAELFVTTKKNEYFDAFLSNEAGSFGLPSWANVKTLGYYTLIRLKKSLPAFAAAKVPGAEANLIKLADQLISKVSGNAFQTVMGGSRSDFSWGSNSVAGNQSIVLLNAYLITKDKKYFNHALSNLDYILGRNATGYCFVTGLGSKSTMNPHHRPSGADGIKEPVPGLLAGGPNPGKQDKCTYEFSEPETSYADVYCSYASNEIAINWNAPLVYVANAIEALQVR